MTHTILRSVPTLVLKEKSATYTGKPIKANKVEATNPNGSSVELAYTYRYYKDNNYIDLFYSKLKNKDIFSEYIEIANGYIEGKCKDVRTKIYS